MNHLWPFWRKKELERGFTAYVNGPHSAKKRVESRGPSRAATRQSDQNQSSPEKSPLTHRSHRKSWVDSDVLGGDDLPEFIDRGNLAQDKYSEDFDMDTSDIGMI